MRTTVLTIVSILILSAILATAADWPQFLGPNGNGVAAAGKAKLADAWPEGGPKVVWSVKTGPGFGGPAIRDGKVYLLDRGAGKDILRCLNLADGVEAWSFTYDAPGKRLGYGGSRSTPAVDDKYVFTIGAYGHLHCVSKATHQSLWSRNILADYQAKLPRWGVAISPMLYKDTVIVAALGKAAGVVCYEKATGKELWKSPAVGPQAYVTPVVLKVAGADQLVVLADGGSRTVGISPVDGKVLWAYRPWKCRIPISAPIDCGDGRVFITGGYGAGSVMLKIAKDGDKFAATEVFRLPKMGSILHPAVLVGDHVYLNANTKSAHDGLACVTLSGQVKWKTGRQPNYEKGCVAVADGKLYILDGKAGVLRMVKPDPSAHTELAAVKVLTKGPFWAPLAIVDGKLICRDQREIKCLDISAP